MIRLIRNELYKTFRFKMVYLFMAILAVHAWLTVRIYSAGGEWKSVITMANGQSLPLALLNSMGQFMIVFIPVFAADLITSEVKSGTVKIALLRPVLRIEWLNAKIVSMFVFITVLLGFSIAAEYAIGTLAFGWGEQTHYAGKLYSETEGIWLTIRLAVSMLLPYMACGMFVVFIALSSTNVSATIGLSIAILTASQYLSEVGSLESYSLAKLVYFFHEQVYQANTDTLFQSVTVLTGYVAACYSVSAMIMKKKNFTS
ncbi:ABC transporter permease [Paenibacillus soyae]|uniref:ABC transporter permease n=1 Tax=Paenibacillus soyae TaxID=2969249 RepID=A0A9X2MSZ1_9BACL|nr:ABC transporter permease [Paenibacillus soyae]MCR2805875.1 ABC transporter permease [Paenibacillus soyae]